MKKRFLQPFFLQFIYKVICKWFLKVVIGVHFGDNRSLMQCDQFIILANHNSHLDTITLLASLPRKMIWKVRPVAAKDYFGSTPLKAAFSNYFINTLLIDRKGNHDSAHSVDRMIEALDNGYSLILFPEGTRSVTGSMDKIKSGIAHVLKARPTIKYIPAYMTGMRQSLPKGEFLVLPYKASVHFGVPTLTESDDVHQIVKQVAADLEVLQDKYQLHVPDEE